MTEQGKHVCSLVEHKPYYTPQRETRIKVALWSVLGALMAGVTAMILLG